MLDTAGPNTSGRGFLDALIGAGIFHPSGVAGIYGRSGVFEDVVAGYEQMLLRLGRDATTETFHFPPGMSRAQFEQTGYMKNFPQLAGSVHSFCGGEHDHMQLLAELDEGRDWAAKLPATDIVLAPAACYPVYPIIGQRGRLPAAGASIALSSYCFRREPSEDPTRMQMFRMREFVRIGTEAQVQEFRQTWMTRALEIAETLMLPAKLDVANDPFFGRGGKMLASSQREQALKLELLIPVTSEDKPTACISVNYHQEHFGSANRIVCADGSPAHSACIGIGVERMALALFRHHGFDVQRWPEQVRKALWG